jgi:hypothetical protein
MGLLDPHQAHAWLAVRSLSARHQRSEFARVPELKAEDWMV